jgi:hypothetical protein
MSMAKYWWLTAAGWQDNGSQIGSDGWTAIIETESYDLAEVGGVHEDYWEFDGVTLSLEKRVLARL